MDRYLSDRKKIISMNTERKELNGGDKLETQVDAQGKDDWFAFLDKNEGGESYEATRDNLKLDWLMGSILVFQATAGVSLYTLQISLYKTGLYSGFFITLVVWYFTCYGLRFYEFTARGIEADIGNGFRVKNAQDLCNHISGNYIPVLKWILTTAMVSSMFSSSCGNISMISNILQTYFSVYPIVTKLAVFIIICMILLVIVEPEKITKYASFSLLVMVMTTIMFFLKNWQISTRSNSPTWEQIPKFDLSGGGKFFGNMLYAYEISSVYLSLRLTTSKTINFRVLTIMSLSVTGLIYYINASSFLFAFSKEKVESVESSFGLYGDEGFIFKYSFVLYIPVLIYYFVMNTIFQTEMIETIPILHNYLTKGSNLNVSRAKIVTLRFIIWGISVGLSIVFTNIVDVLSFSGAVFSPLMNSIVPTIVYFRYCQIKGIKSSLFRRIHDIFFLIAGVSILIWGVYDTIFNDSE